MSEKERTSYLREHITAANIKLIVTGAAQQKTVTDDLKVRMDRFEQNQKDLETNQLTKIKDIMEVQTVHGRLMEKIMVAMGLKIEDGPAKITKIDSTRSKKTRN